MQPAVRHLLTLCAILVLTTLLYSRITTCYFCGFDDFIEIHRAAFEDKADPVKILTTTHYNSFKYRPLNRALNLYTYLIDPHSALQFRIRNLLFHGLAIVSVYWLGWLLFHTFWAAAAPALLFAISPLVNQPVIGAVWNNTVANSLLLLSLALFLWAVQSGRVARLVLALICGAVSVYTYEANLMGAVLMASWMVLDYLFKRRLPSRSFLLVFVLFGGLLYGSYLGVRHYVVIGQIPSPPISSLGAMARNVTLYSAGILVPFDLVLAADWFGTPRPKELLISMFSPGPTEFPLGALGLFIIVGVGVMVMALLLLFAGRKRIAAWLNSVQWQPVLFLLMAMPFSILPLLLFTEHPSETYVYLPVAFYCLILGYVVSCIRTRALFAAVLGAFVLLYGTATWVRNQDVARCAITARTILSNLPEAEWKQGQWHIRVAKAPDEINVMPYGFYNYYGLDTLGIIGGFGTESIEYALQTAYGNGQLQVEAFTPETLPSHCTSLGPRDACYWVHQDGRVTAFGQPSQR